MSNTRPRNLSAPGIDITDQQVELIQLLNDVKQLFLQRWNEISICAEWIPKSQVQKYFGYADTQFSSLVLQGDLITTKIGRRVFVSKESIKALLERNAQP